MLQTIFILSIIVYIMEESKTILFKVCLKCLTTKNITIV